jgi:thioester reductase-like protein
MAYFVTGGTGFIGRFLVADLLERGDPVYLLVRKSSHKKLAALRKEWGASETQVIAVTGDLAKPLLGVADSDIARLAGKVSHMFISPPSTT